MDQSPLQFYENFAIGGLAFCWVVEYSCGQNRNCDRQDEKDKVS
jgi:hypothetical protein